jgi:uncharacterized membrane protein (DUF485 family)
MVGRVDAAGNYTHYAPHGKRGRIIHQLCSPNCRTPADATIPRPSPISAKRKTGTGGRQMDERALARIQGDPNYIKLVAERKSYGWTLAIVMLVLYYGFIAIVAFDPLFMGVKLAGVITVGLVMGVALILISIILTGIYVLRANSTYDDLTAEIVAANGGRK